MHSSLNSEAACDGPLIYVVSLKRAVERRRAITEHLDAYGLDFIFIDAVDAAQTDPEILRAQVDEAAVFCNIGRPLSGPEIACALSHRLIYADILDRKLAGAIVLEDDVTITPVFLDALAHFRQRSAALAHKRAIYHMGALSQWYAHNVSLRGRSALRVSECLSFAAPIERLSTEVWGTFGYYVTREAASSLLTSERLETVADHWSLWAKRSSGKIFVSMPAIVAHPTDLSNSDLEAIRLAARNSAEEKGRSNQALAFFTWAVDAAKDAVVKNLVRPIAERVL